MNALTDNAAAVLVAAAQQVGEPGEAIDLAHLAREQGVTVRGLRAHTMPALERRGYVEPEYVGTTGPDYALTNAGFAEAERRCGGHGLL